MKRTQSRRSRVSQLLLGAAPALLLMAAAPAHAGVSGDFRTCERQDQHHIGRAIEACGAVIENERATLRQIQHALIARANMRVGRFDLEGARADLEQAQRMGAEDPTTMVALGQVRARLNDPDAALAAFNAATGSATSHDADAAFEAWIATGQLQLERQQWARAIESYTAALRVTSDDSKEARALIGRGHARVGAGNPDAALRDYGSAVERDPDSVDALLALADLQRTFAVSDEDNFAAAAGTYAIALEKIGDNVDQLADRQRLARAYAGRGDLYLQRYFRRRAHGDFQQASRDFEGAVAADSENVSALIGRAAAYTELPATRQRAVTDLSRAIRLAPDNGEIYRRRGDVYALSGNDEGAMRDYDDALQRGDTQSYRTYFQRGVIYYNARDFVRADQSFAQAAALARHGPLPPDIDTGTAMAEALSMRSRATWSLIDAPGFVAQDIALRARNYADEAAQWRPNQSRYEAGRCLTRSVAGGEWSIAEQACRTAIALAGTNTERADAFGAMGMLQLRWALAGAPDGAIEATHLQFAVNYFGDAASTSREAGDAALYRYAQGVTLECLGRQIEGNRLMRQALDADRSVEARFLTHRIRHCQA